MSLPVSDAVAFRLKSATRDLIRACGGLDRSSQICGLSTTHLSRCQQAAPSANGNVDLIGLAQILALEADCGVPFVTSAMADLNGRRLTDPEADARQAVTLSFLSRGAEVAAASASFLTAQAEAVRDLDVSPAEFATMDRALSNIVKAVDTARRECAAGMAQGGLKVVGG